MDLKWKATAQNKGIYANSHVSAYCQGTVSAEVGAAARLFWRNVFISWYVYNIHIH